VRAKDRDTRTGGNPDAYYSAGGSDRSKQSGDNHSAARSDWSKQSGDNH
jgi:hypothetical protein